jgi:hypothetical protein
MLAFAQLLADAIPDGASPGADKPCPLCYEIEMFLTCTLCMHRPDSMCTPTSPLQLKKKKQIAPENLAPENLPPQDVSA